MLIQKTAHDDTHELILSGRCDGEGANKLEVAIRQTIATGAKAITVEMSDVTFLGSAGLRTLLQCWRQLLEKGGTLQVVDPSQEAMTALITAGFKSILIGQC